MLRTLLLYITVSLCCVTALFAQTHAPTTSTSKPTTSPLTLQVKSIEGVAQVRESKGGPAVLLNVGTVLKSESRVFVGPRSTLTISTDGGEELVIGRLMSFDVSEVRRAEDGKLALGRSLGRETRTIGANGIDPPRGFPRNQPATTRPAAVTAEDVDAIREVVLRDVLKGYGRGEPCRVRVQQINGMRAQVSREFLGRLADLGLRFVRDEDVVDPEVSLDNFGWLNERSRERTTGKAVPTFFVEIEDWFDETEVYVKAGEVWGALNSSGYYTTVKKVNGKWVLNKDGSDYQRWIS